jgi:hypothetical protein
VPLGLRSRLLSMQTSLISLSLLFGMPSLNVVEEAFYKLRLCGVVHGSRRAGFKNPALLLVALADVGYAFSDRTLWYYRRSSPPPL